MRCLAVLVLFGCGTSPPKVSLWATGVSDGTDLALHAYIDDLDDDGLPSPHQLQPMERVVAAVDGQTVELANIGVLPPDSIAGTSTDFFTTTAVTGSGGDLVWVADTSDNTLDAMLTVPDDFELRPIPATMTIHGHGTIPISWTPQKKDWMQLYLIGDPDCVDGSEFEYPSRMLDVGGFALPAEEVGDNCPVTVVVERYRAGVAGDGIQRRTATTTITHLPD